MKKLLLTVLTGLTLATLAAPRVHADPGEACTTSDGHSGYMVATGRSGEVCQAE